MDGSQGRGDGERAVPAQDDAASTESTTETTTREHVETTGPATDQPDAEVGKSPSDEGSLD